MLSLSAAFEEWTSTLLACWFSFPLVFIVSSIYSFWVGSFDFVFVVFNNRSEFCSTYKRYFVHLKIITSSKSVFFHVFFQLTLNISGEIRHENIIFQHHKHHTRISIFRQMNLQNCSAGDKSCSAAHRNWHHNNYWIPLATFINRITNATFGDTNEHSLNHGLLFTLRISSQWMLICCIQLTVCSFHSYNNYYCVDRRNLRSYISISQGYSALTAIYICVRCTYVCYNMNWGTSTTLRMWTVLLLSSLFLTSQPISPQRMAEQ